MIADTYRRANGIRTRNKAVSRSLMDSINLKSIDKSFGSSKETAVNENSLYQRIIRSQSTMRGGRINPIISKPLDMSAEEDKVINIPFVIAKFKNALAKDGYDHEQQSDTVQLR